MQKFRKELRNPYLENGNVTGWATVDVGWVVLAGDVDLDNVDSHSAGAPGIEVGDTGNDLQGVAVKSSLLVDDTVSSGDDVSVVNDAATADALATDFQGDLVGVVAELGVVTSDYTLALQTCLD